MTTRSVPIVFSLALALAVAPAGCGQPHATRGSGGGAGGGGLPGGGGGDVAPGDGGGDAAGGDAAGGIGGNPDDRVGGGGADDPTDATGGPIADGPLRDGAHGSPCERRSDCDGGACLNLPGGYCTQIGCAVDAECGDGALCLPVDRSGTRACLAECGDPADCRPGYGCTADGACLPGEGDAPGGDVDPGGGGPGDGDPAAGGAGVGQACRLDADCGGNADHRACFPAEDGFPGGYCTLVECRPGSCPDGSDCFQVTPDGLTACLDLCDGGCRAGYACRGGRACMPEVGGGPGDADPGDDNPADGFGSPIGGECGVAGDCATPGAICVPEEDGFPGGYCVLMDCGQGDCPQGSDCFQVSEDGATACLATCAGGCRAGYECVQDLACMPEEEGGGDPGPGPDDPGGGGGGGGGGAPIGGACGADRDCADPGAVCLTEAQGFAGGYCTVFNCDRAGCPDAAECFQVAEDGTTACLDTCGRGCRDGYECVQDLACMPAGGGDAGGAPDCEADGDCGDGQSCIGGRCVVPAGDVPPGPAPRCAAGAGGIPDWRCNGGERVCGQVVAFAPDEGPGWWDYPLNGETARDQYRSYLRQDFVQLAQYAAAMVDCLAAGWDFGNHEPLGLGDMSEANGDIPGTREGDPGHPAGTHVDGHDMDIAYYQVGTADNTLRPVCEHTRGGRDQYHCVDAPNLLDPWRTALFIAYLHQSPQLRVIGVDGRVGPIIEGAVAQLCAEGWVPGDNPACRERLSLAFETVDEGRGWYSFHHHHMHVSLMGQDRQVASENPETVWGPDACITLDCGAGE